MSTRYYLLSNSKRYLVECSKVSRIFDKQWFFINGTKHVVSKKSGREWRGEETYVWEQVFDTDTPIESLAKAQVIYYDQSQGNEEWYKDNSVLRGERIVGFSSKYHINGPFHVQEISLADAKKMLP
jgi:hypothetical protein